MKRRILSRHPQDRDEARGYCTSCRRVCDHRRRILTDEQGHCYAVWGCGCCGETFHAGGLCCVACGCQGFRTIWIRPQHPGEITRCLECQQCSERYIGGQKLGRRIGKPKPKAATIEDIPPRTWEIACERFAVAIERAIRSGGVWGRWADRASRRT